MKILLTSIFFIIGLFISGNSLGKTPERTFASYSLPESMETLKIIKPGEPIEEIEPGTYSVKAYVSLKTEKDSEVFEDWEFEPTRNELDASYPKEGGWSAQGTKYLWRPIAQDESILIPLTPDSSKQAPHITNFNQLHIDFEELYPKNSSQMYLEMVIKSDKSGKTLNAAGGLLGAQLLENLDVLSAQWKKKNWLYLAKRTIGLPLDTDWQYSPSGQSVVLQRRFHKDLESGDKMFLHFSQETEAKKIKITLRLGFDELFETDTVVFWEDIPKGPIRTINKRKILPINLGELVRTRFSHKKKTILKEVAIFIPNQQAQESAGRFLEEVVFLKQQNQNQKFDLIFPASTEIISDTRKRLVLDIRRLSEKIDLDSKLIKMNLTIQPKSVFSPSGLNIKRVRMVSLVNNKKPSFLMTKEKLNRKWGGPFLVAEHEDNHSEWIQMDSYLPFHLSRLKYKDKAQEDQKEDNSLQTKKEETEKKNFKIFQKSITTKKIGGITATASAPFRDWLLDSNGLTLEGDGRWMEIDWPVKAHLQSATRFFSKVTSDAENIVSMELTPTFNGEKLSSHKFLPNQPLHINGKSQVIDHLKIRIIFRGSSFRLTLQELALFTPLSIPKSEILDTLTTISGETPLISEQKPRSLESQQFYDQNSFNSSLSDARDDSEIIRGSLEINRKVERIHGLKLKNNAPIDSQEQYVSCWLQLTVIGTKHKFEKTICPQQSSGEIFISQEDLFYETDIAAEEIIKTIAWKIFRPFPSKEASSSARNIRMSILGLDIQSIRSDISKYPIMQLKGETIFPTSLKNKSENGLLKGNIWLDLGTITVTDSDTPRSIFQFMDHPYLQSDMLILEESKPFLLKGSQPLMGQQHTTNDSFQISRLIPLLKNILIILAIFGVFRWSKKKNWRPSLGAWLKKMLTHISTRETKFTLISSAGLCLCGALAIFLGTGKPALFFFQFAAILPYRLLILKIRPTLETLSPMLASRIYGGAGAHYIAGFLLTLFPGAVLLVLKFEQVAEQIVGMGYLMLIIGVIKASLALRHRTTTNTEIKAAENETTGA